MNLLKRLSLPTLLLFGAVRALVFAADGISTDKAQLDELKKFEGKWVAFDGEYGGERFSEKVRQDFPNGIIHIKGDKLQIKGKNGELIMDSTIKLNPAAKPKTIDVLIHSGEDKGQSLAGKKSLGIYEMKGDTFKGCYELALDEKARPSEFKTSKENGYVIYEYKRIKE